MNVKTTLLIFLCPAAFFISSVLGYTKEVKNDSPLSEPQIKLNEEVHTLEIMFANDYKKAANYFKSLIGLFGSYLEQTNSKSAAFVMLWKLITVLPQNGSMVLDDDDELVDHVNLIANKMKPYVRDYIEGAEEVVNYTKHLSLFDHCRILKYFDDNFPHDDAGWIYVGYSLILENSKYLENRVPQQMLQRMLESCIGGNAQYILYIDSIPTTKEKLNSEQVKFGQILVKKRFEFNWNYYRGELTTEIKLRFAVRASEYAVNNLRNNYPTYLDNIIKHFDYTNVVSSISELASHESTNFQDLTYNVELNFAIFDLAKGDSYVEACRDWLVDKCKGSRVLETGLKAKGAVMDGIQPLNGLAKRDAFHVVMDQGLMRGSKQAMEYNENLLQNTKNRLDVQTIQNFTDYIKLLQLARDTQTVNWNFLKELHLAYFKFVNKPSLFENFDELFLVDELHHCLYERMRARNPISFSYSQYIEKNAIGMAFKNFKHVFDVNPNDSKEIRRQRRILLKMFVILAKATYNGNEPIDQTGINQIIQINKLFYRLAKDDDMSDASISNDCCLMTEWYSSGISQIQQVATLYLQENNSDFNFVYKSLEESRNLEKSAAVFLCVLNTIDARYNHGLESHPDQLLKNAVDVENNIGETVWKSRCLQTMIIKLRTSFYYKYIDAISPLRNKYIRKYIDSMIAFMLDKHISPTIFKFDYLLFSALNKAISGSSDGTETDLKAKLGTNSVETLDQLEYALYLDFKEVFEEKVRSGYEELRKLLEFKLVPAQT